MTGMSKLDWACTAVLAVIAYLCLWVLGGRGE